MLIGLMKLFASQHYGKQLKVSYYERNHFKRYGWAYELFKNIQDLFYI